MRSLLLLLSICSCALSAPAWKAELSPVKPGSHPPIGSSTLDFVLSWKGMVKAGILNLEFAPRDTQKPGSLVIKSSAASQGAAAILFPYKHRHWSEINPSTLGSKYFHSTEEDSEEMIITRNRFTSSGVKSQEATTDLKSKAVSTESFVFPYANARDMFSAILYIRSQKLAPGEEHTLLLLPFKTPYLLKVRVEAKEKHLGRDALRLSFALRRIDRKTLELGTYKKLKKPVTVWLSDDADRIPIELRASVYIGDVRAVMTSFKKNL
jgi:hypothetical protein